MKKTITFEIELSLYEKLKKTKRETGSTIGFQINDLIQKGLNDENIKNSRLKK